MKVQVLLFVFGYVAVFSAGQANFAGAEQKEQSNDNESIDDTLNSVKKVEEEFKELNDTINSMQQATGSDTVSFLDIQALDSIVRAVISKEKQDLDEAKHELNGVVLTLDEEQMAFAQVVENLEDAIKDDDDDDEDYVKDDDDDDGDDDDDKGNDDDDDDGDDDDDDGDDDDNDYVKDDDNDGDDDDEDNHDDDDDDDGDDNDDEEDNDDDDGSDDRQDA